MIKLKQGFGNVKCKVEAECVVSKYEISILRNQPINGLLAIQNEKNLEITYVCDTKKTLAQKAQLGLNKDTILEILRQIADAAVNVKKVGLDYRKIILNQEWIYYAEQSKEVQLIYCPVNGCNINYDLVLFLKDLMFSAKVDVDTRERIQKWIQAVEMNGLTNRCMDALHDICRTARSLGTEGMQAGNRTVSLSVDEEPPTGMDEEEFCYDEVPTGIDVDEIYTSDDEEAPTGMDDEEGETAEDERLYSSLGKSDGTFSETTSESGYYSIRPSLRRISTGERIVINKDEFKIGRSMQRADYCITNNNSVSNIHAIIFTNNGSDYYLKDNRSTNGTIVDGTKVDENGTLVKLKNGSRICLFNEELEFWF